LRNAGSGLIEHRPTNHEVWLIFMAQQLSEHETYAVE
jgi:hypothetical protein